MLLLALAVAIPLVAFSAFLNDLFPNNWRNWAVAAAVVAGAIGAIIAFRQDSLGRAVIWLASLTVVTFLIIYDVLDALIDPFIEADWPVAVVAILLVLGLGSLLGALISDDE
jgi:hypothetical protein